MMILIGRGLDFRLETETDWKNEEQWSDESKNSRLCSCQGAGRKKITLSGGDNEGVPPVPIPNTEVKPFSADGTWLETARESRSLPDSISARCESSGLYSYTDSPQSQWSRLPTGELAPLRLTLPPAGHPPQAAAGGSPGFHISPLR